MADGIIINKADGDIDKANLAAAQFRNAPYLFPARRFRMVPQSIDLPGYYNIGIKEIWDMAGEYMEFTKKTATSITNGMNRPRMRAKVSTIHYVKHSIISCR